MPDPSAAPPDRPEGVRTGTPPSLLGSRCPVCQGRVLQGRQTVCSGRCRAKRWRESRAIRDPEVRAALEAIAQLVQVTLRRLPKGSAPCPDPASRVDGWCSPRPS